ncbi:MAG TPA: S41 family peptidase [Bacteroidia bacterium]|nr:S41 family peptidase [Bacteroidia bacterium]
MNRIKCLFYCITATLPLLATAQTDIEFYKKAQQLIGDFETHHIQPIETNDSTSKEVTELLIDNLDSYGLTLKAPDVKLLREKGNSLFTEIQSNRNDYLYLTIGVFKKALQCTDSIYNALLLRPLNFKEKDSVTFAPFDDDVFFSPDIPYHAKRIRRYVKSLCLDKAFALYKDGLPEEEFHDRAGKLCNNIIKRLRKNIQDQINNVQQSIETNLLNSIALRYDPHSNFFTYAAAKKFNQSLSAHVETFGFVLSENNNGLTEVSYISPGGSAWISNEVNVGDIVISVTLDNKSHSGDENDTEALENIINSTIAKTLELEIKKKNGSIKTVRLIKRKTQSDENFVKGYVLKANNFHIGYIDLPSFYIEMNNPLLPGCANDVAKEILKLENDSIQGLIIDLRNNGGGSMFEAMNLAGIFINEGPLFIYKEKNEKPFLMKDLNRGSVFKKPIVVLVNEFSASASELFCNIIKDYNLGLIAGQISYGKGTAQTILPLDTNLITSKKIDYTKKIDYVKITNGRFYRLNCTTHQGIGVVPDIIFPSFTWLSTSYKENKSPYFLHPDSIQKKVTYTPLPSLPVKQLSQKSSDRQKFSSDFQNFISCSDSIRRLFQSPKKIALCYNQFTKHIKQIDNMIARAEEISIAKKNIIKTYNNSFDKKLYELDPLLNDFNNQILKSINEDMFINEAYLILNDIINP